MYEYKVTVDGVEYAKKPDLEMLKENAFLRAKVEELEAIIQYMEKYAECPQNCKQCIVTDLCTGGNDKETFGEKLKRQATALNGKEEVCEVKIPKGFNCGVNCTCQPHKPIKEV